MFWAKYNIFLSSFQISCTSRKSDKKQISNISSSNYTTKKMRRMQLEVVQDVDHEKQFEEEKLLVP